jgi:predicted ArsR family transcriptional regulator
LTVTRSRLLQDTGDRIADVTARKRLHQLVDELSEQEADDALRYIAQRREDPVLAAFRDAPEDDEPFTAADEDALAEVHADRTAGVPRISYAEIMRKHGDS